MSKSGKYCEKCAREKNDFQDANICVYKQGRKKCQMRTFGEFCKKHQNIMNEAKEAKRCNAVITSKGLKNGGICHQLVVEGTTFCKTHQNNSNGICSASRRDGSACPNRAIKNGLCGQHQKKKKDVDDIKEEDAEEKTTPVEN